MSATKSFGLPGRANLANAVTILPLILVVLALLSPNFSYGQSTWRPRTGGGGSSPPNIPPPKFDIPDVHRFRPIDTLEKSSKKEDKSAVPDTSIYNDPWRVRATDDSTSVYHSGYSGGGEFMSGWLFRPVRAGLFSVSLDSGLPTPEVAAEGEVIHDPKPSEKPHELHYGKKFRISVYYTGTYVKLEELNTRLIDYELNALDYRNHEPMHYGDGFGLVFERYFSERWSWQFSFEWLNLESTDRQSWTVKDPDTGEVDTIRDEQILQIKTLAGAFDFKRLIPVGDVLLSVGLGVEGRMIEMNIGYRFGEKMMYDYWTEPKVVPGLRAITGFSTGLWRSLVLNLDGGYRLLSPVNPSIEGSEWYWESPSDKEKASIDMSGFFWNAGVGVQF